MKPTIKKHILKKKKKKQRKIKQNINIGLGAKVACDISFMCIENWFRTVEMSQKTYLEAECGDDKKWQPSDIVKLKEL